MYKSNISGRYVMLLQISSTAQHCEFEQNTIIAFQHIKPISNVPKSAVSNDRSANNTSNAIAVTDKTKLCGIGPRANYTDRVTAACWRS
jgi:hypothetical protein